MRDIGLQGLWGDYQMGNGDFRYQFLVIFLTQIVASICFADDLLDLREAVARTTSVEEFLAVWKEQKPQYFSNYVLAYRSRSLQSATASKPRVLLFNEKADLVVTFNNAQSTRGSKNLEVMAFNHEDAHFEFYEVSFKNGRSQFSEKNPVKCLECHQSSARRDVDPRPNWEPYNVWPGFYGSLDDDTELFKNNPHTKAGFDLVLDQFLLNEFDQEETLFKKFKDEVLTVDPRYQFLQKTLVDQYGYKDKTLNGDLTNRLAALNFKRVARLMKSYDDIYQTVKWTAWAHANCYQNVYMPASIYEKLYSWVENSDRERSKEKARNLPQRFYQREIQKWVVIKPPTFKVIDNTDIINVLYEPFGVSTEDWSMDFKTDGGRFAAFERFGVSNDPRPPWKQAILQEWVKKDPDFKDMTCEKAVEKSLLTFANESQVEELRKNLQQPKVVEQKPLLARCVSCHSEAQYDEAPYIPFHDVEKLKPLLLRKGYKRGTLFDEVLFRIGPHATETEQMPPRGLPTNHQREELKKYLTRLIQDL